MPDWLALQDTTEAIIEQNNLEIMEEWHSLLRNVA
jgi:hypothetical protein